ncbi:amidohydrolase family protein [Clostridium sp. 'deep sea']|uniref:amidohydrolase family protein n=1 Tax=Clostridium sp. 'deep sea' TaxID=2779445 RepID=UPI00189695DD|nr:TatD family hydrolase [Clostridium sp. 'deep sea']QOR36793.1 amidohydrolase family protein [Clostridium sp. 'deep sea']
MKIIDAHIHFSNIQSFKDTAKAISIVDYSYEGFSESFAKNKVVASIGMGIQEKSAGAFPDNKCRNPMILDLAKKTPNNLFCCLGINPTKLLGLHANDELENIEKYLKYDNFVGIKIYAGYYHFHVFDKVYEPIYDLAASYKVPVVIHSGDTYSERGLLKYSHPLNVDELAVTHRDVNFVIAHMGCPWTMDCAEVVSKNSNVYADLSGLIIGDNEAVSYMGGQKLYQDHFKKALIYAENYEKFLFGSDWPLVDLASYINFVKQIVPNEHHKNVFYNNAKELFKLSI